MLKYEAFICIHLLRLFFATSTAQLPPCYYAAGKQADSRDHPMLRGKCNIFLAKHMALPPPPAAAASTAGDRPLRSLTPARRLRRSRPPPSIPPILPLPTNTQDYASYAAASFGVLAG
ncbi:hypothetical protein V2W45_1343095 [Cenococcum geophilum]